MAAAVKVIFEDIGTNAASLAGARHLIEAEVDPTVHASIVDVVGYLRELGVVKDHVWNDRVRQGDVMGSTGWRRAVIGALRDQRVSGGHSDSDTVVFGLAVRDSRKRVCTS